MAYSVQNFYKQTLLLDWTIGLGNFYVSVKPQKSTGWLVISPNNSTLREIVKYTGTGTDTNGDYVTISQRGVGGTTEQTHTVGEPIRQNITAEYLDDINTQIASIVASGVVNANTTTMGGVEIATLAEALADTDVGGTGANLVALPSSITAKIKANMKFGGNGADGALSISSGTTTIDCASAKIKILNYSSISITGTGKLAFSNPHASGTIIVIRCSGNCTLISSSAPMIDASNMGAAGGIVTGDGANGVTESYIKTNGGKEGNVRTGGVTGSLTTTPMGDLGTLPTQLFSKYPRQFVGAGGGAGHISTYAGSPPTILTGSLNGGNGGGCLIIEIAGAINFTTTNGISVAGSTGGSPLTQSGGTSFAIGGGGGGGGGSCFIFYNTLTAFSGTVKVSGGVGGNMLNVSTWTGSGGGGGGSALNAGSDGSLNTTNGVKTGGDGGAGLEVHGLNTEFF